MRYRPLGRSGLDVSVVGLGCNNLGRRLDADRTRAVVDAALEAGITLFDTAETYGGQGASEELLGRALVGRRDSALIATKFGAARSDMGFGAAAGAKGGRGYIRRAVEASLRRLRTDYIDLYQIHTPDPATPIAETLDALDELVREGKVRYLGHSNFTGWQLAEAAHVASERGRTPFVSAQNHWSLLHRAAEAELVPAALHYGVGVLPYSPLANGILTGKVRRGRELPAGSRIAERPQQVTEQVLERVEALAAWGDEHGRSLLDIGIGALAARPGCGSVIAGATSPEQVKANAAAADWEPTAEELAEIDAIVPARPGPDAGPGRRGRGTARPVRRLSRRERRTPYEEPAVSLPPLVDPAPDLTVDEVRRYSRHIIIPEVGMAGQKRLKNAKVLVIGAGGLGSPALLYLAAAGVGMLGIVDFDEVDESNLQRQVIHGQSDVGKPKAVSAQESIAEINPFTKVVLHEVRLDSSNALEIFEGYDLILDGTDNFPTRYLVNDAAVLTGKPYVWGSIFRFEGQVSVFWAEHGPHYRDLYPEPPPPGMVPSCAEGGVLGVLCASIGSVMVNEAIKLITGIGEPLVGRLLIFDALEMSWRELKVGRDPDTEPVTELIDYEEFCGAVSDEAAEAVVDSTIDVRTLKEWLDARERGDRDFMLVDVREPNEWDIVNIPGAVLIPKGEFLSGEAFEKLPKDKQVVLHCKVGGRSAEALAAAKGAGFADAVHVGGGISAWVSQIEPDKPSY